jgi:hypothetical protein
VEGKEDLQDKPKPASQPSDRKLRAEGESTRQPAGNEKVAKNDVKRPS